MSKSRLVLAGGGHTHSLFLLHWAANAHPDIEVVLISPQPATPYSGMLPGLIAGHFTQEEIHIDLPKLCKKAGARFVRDAVTGLNADKRQVLLAGGQRISYDLLSMDIGSTPDLSVPGSGDHAIPVKPIAGFYRSWLQVRDKLRTGTQSSRIAMVGGGAGAVELVLAMAESLRKDDLITVKPDFTLLLESSAMLPAYPRACAGIADAACRALNIRPVGDFRVSRVERSDEGPDVYSAGGDRERCDYLFWCTQAAAATWPGEGGLAVSRDGFIRVDESLRSVSHPSIFAAGDIAHMDASPRPKAGVYAVRQAPYLYRNICAVAAGDMPGKYCPQDRFLSIITLGSKRAMASRGVFPVLRGQWVWHWKRRIDLGFMEQFA